MVRENRYVTCLDRFKGFLRKPLIQKELSLMAESDKSY
jgi:hypothetical protein